jgi:alpha-L-fucosidase 2
MKSQSRNVGQERRGRSFALPSLIAIASALFCFSTHQARAQVINFDVPGGAGGTNYSGQGAYADSGKNFWNAINPNGTATSCKLDDGTTSSAITLTVSSDTTYTGTQGAQGTPSALQSPFLGANGPKTCSLNNVPAGDYMLYLYGINGDSTNRGTIFTVNINGTQWNTSTTENTSAASNTFTQGNDYAVVQVHVGPGTGTITFTYQANAFVQVNGANNTIGCFNGVQLVTWNRSAVQDAWTAGNAITTARLYQGVRTTSTTSYSTETAGGQLMGNGNLGVEVFGSINSQVYVLAKNDFFSQEQGQIKAMTYMTIAVPNMSSASYNMVEDVWNGEVIGTFTQSGNTMTTTSWVQATDAVHNWLYTEFKYTGSGSQTVNLSFAPGTNNTFPTSSGTSGNVTYYNVQADANASHLNIPSVFVRAASTVIGATPTVSNGSLSFTVQPGNTYTVVTCVMSNWDDLNYQSETINSISGLTQSAVDAQQTASRCWWNWHFGHSFVILGDKTLEKQWYASTYLSACESREFQVAPGLWGNWIMEDTAWQGDYTLDYNFQLGIDDASVVNDADMQQGYDAAILNWLPHGQFNAIQNGFKGAYYEVHIGPLPWGSTESAVSPTHGQGNPYENMKSNGNFAAMPMLDRYYTTHDPVYGQEIFGYLRQLATFWQNYLTLNGSQYDSVNDARGEFATYPQVDPMYERAFILKVMQGCIDLANATNSFTSQIPTWQNIINNLYPYPTMTQGGQVTFSATSNPIFFKLNGYMVQECYPADEIALDSNPTDLVHLQNTFNQEQGTNGGFTGDHTPLVYAAAARMGWSASSIVSNLDTWIGNQVHTGSLEISSGSGGTENVVTVPACVSEMVLQSCLGTIRIFPNWPSTTSATYSNLMARGGFLVSSSINTSHVVQYVRIISEQGQSALMVNPWPGQTVQVYRNGVSAGTVSGTTFTLTTSVGDVIHLAPSGTSYAQILSLMGPCFSETVNPATAGPYTLSFLVAAPTAVTGAFHISNSSGTNLSGNVNVPATGGWQTFTTVTAVVNLPAGQQVLNLNEDNAGWTINDVGFSGITAGGGTEGPFGGTPAPIPGTVQAENYDTGGQGLGYNVTSINGTDNGYRSDGVDLEACSDTGGGVDLGWESPGQWFRYTVNVATAGTYTVSFRVAAPNAVTDAFHLSNSSGTNLSGNINVPATGGYQTWATVTASVTLPAGQQVLTLNQDTGGGAWNINYMGFASSGSNTLQPTQNATVRSGTYANTNYNGATTIRVKNDPPDNTRNVYLTFDTSSMPSVSSAVINLYVVGTGTTASRTISVYQEPTTSWLESTITWNNAPAAGTLIGTFNVSTTTGIYYNFDVTSYVQAQRAAGNNIVSFVLVQNTADTNGLVDFASREATTGQPGLTIAP